mmetsp:Transcript_11402/g.21149  ORF Transcript_11402/g.21149 Transcript_11402/m.21149 type:complete len:130 (+) Transcript_11402:3-392(+)
MDVFEWNSGGFHATVYDDTPITAGRHGLRFSKDITPEELQNLENELMASCRPSANGGGADQFSDAQSDVPSLPSNKKSKPFLKRGQGRVAVGINRKRPPSTSSTNNTHNNTSPTPDSTDRNNIPTSTIT